MNHESGVRNLNSAGHPGQLNTQTHICRSHPAPNGQLHDQFQQKEQALGAPECNFVNSEYVFSHKR